MGFRVRRSLAGGAIAAAAVAAAVVAGPAMTGQDAAQASHNAYQNIYHSNQSVVPVLTFANDVGASSGLSRGYSSCCYRSPSIYLGAGHDAIVTYRERTYATRISATGWSSLPALNSPGHITVRIVNNGGN